MDIGKLILVGGGTVLMLYLGIFGNLQVKFSDLLFAPRPTSGKIIIVAIDDKSIQKIGRWPWDRKVFAEEFWKIKNPPEPSGLTLRFLKLHKMMKRSVRLC